MERPRVSKHLAMALKYGRSLVFERPSKRARRLEDVADHAQRGEESHADDVWKTISEPLGLSNLDLKDRISCSPGLVSEEFHASHFPLENLPDHLICCITNFLRAPDLNALSKANHRFQRVCQTNQAGWENLCQDLWSRKVHVLPEARNNPSCKEAYRQSVNDALVRQHVTMKELVYDPDTNQGTVWSFRFKESAGLDWTNLDPWYSGGPCRQFVFLADGTVREFYKGRLRRPSFGPASTEGEGTETGTHNRNNNNDEQNTISLYWRFTHRPMDLPERPLGSYVRLTVAGREVPTYVVHRSPTNNWGFVMESCWGLYASFPLPPRRLRPRALSPDTWLRGEIDEQMANQRLSNVMRRRQLDESQRQEQTLEDSQLLLTNQLQWREAFLYNAGAHHF